MSRLEKWCFHLSNLLVSGTGIALFYVKYFLRNDDPFSVINHPWQPAIVDLHLVSAPVLVFVLGAIFSTHISKKLRNKTLANRRSGLIALFSFPLMALSGYLLQVATQPWFRQSSLVLHLASSVVFLTGYAAHQIISSRLLRRARAIRQVEGIGVA